MSDDDIRGSGTESTNTHEVSEADARASQFYVAEVTSVRASMGADPGDRELILTDTFYQDGATYSAASYGGQQPKRYEIIGFRGEYLRL